MTDNSEHLGEPPDGMDQLRRYVKDLGLASPSGDDFSMCAAIIVRELAEEFVQGNANAKAAYESMRSRGMTHGDANKEIAMAMTAVMWAVERGMLAGEEANTDVLYPALNLMRKGETAVSIFTDEWRGKRLDGGLQ